MTPELVRFIRNVTDTFRRLPLEQLYQVAVSLRDELSHRAIDAGPEADALVAALLVALRAQRQRIHSADCSPAE